MACWLPTSACWCGQASTLDATTLTVPGPGTWLISVSAVRTDTDNTVLGFVNAAAPNVPFSGPGGLGGLLPTRRADAAVLAITAGLTVPAGSAGLYVVTVATGATSIVTGNITLASGAPFVTKLPFLAPLSSPGFSGTPTAPTPALNDDSTKLATTAFVQELIGNVSGSSSGNLSGEAAVRAAADSAEAALRIAGDNNEAAIRAAADSNEAILRANADVTEADIRGAADAAEANARLTGDNVEATARQVADAAVEQWALGQIITAQQQAIAAAVSQVNAEFDGGLIYGWQRLPSGLIMQFGQVLAATEVTTTFNFPESFPSSCISVVVSKGSVINLGGEYAVGCNYISQTQFNISVSNTIPGAQGIFFLAFGY